MSEITPEQLAAALTGGFVADKGLNGWVVVSAEGNIATIAFTPARPAPGGSNVQRFRAVVVEGEQTPIVLERPDLTDGWEFEGGHYNDDLTTGWQVCAVNSDARSAGMKYANSILFRGSGHITTAEARRFAAALVAKADAVDAAQAEQDGAA